MKRLLLVIMFVALLTGCSQNYLASTVGENSAGMEFGITSGQMLYGVGVSWVDRNTSEDSSYTTDSTVQSVVLVPTGETETSEEIETQFSNNEMRKLTKEEQDNLAKKKDMDNWNEGKNIYFPWGLLKNGKYVNTDTGVVYEEQTVTDTVSALVPSSNPVNKDDIVLYGKVGHRLINNFFISGLLGSTVDYPELMHGVSLDYILPEKGIAFGASYDNIRDWTGMVGITYRY